ncbi:MAG: (d)CMP kinase [Phycisphaera sp.]|nr:(d)CMP kinase [Phycisphaera sp.]
MHSNHKQPDQRIVTIDGPAGAGKSSVSREVAHRLGLDFLDTGAMYRAVAVAALSAGLDTADTDAVGELAEGLEVRFDWTTDPPRMLVDGLDVTDRLRDADTTAAVSDIACNSRVRRVLVEAQRRIGREHPNLLTEGRDQGSVVFTDAAVKFYLDATPEERARRRTRQLQDAGKEADEQQILDAIIRRDERDRSREDGPLVCPDGAIVVDTSDMTQQQVVELLTAKVQVEFAARAQAAGDTP